MDKFKKQAVTQLKREAYRRITAIAKSKGKILPKKMSAVIDQGLKDYIDNIADAMQQFELKLKVGKTQETKALGSWLQEIDESPKSWKWKVNVPKVGGQTQTLGSVLQKEANEVVKALPKETAKKTAAVAASTGLKGKLEDATTAVKEAFKGPETKLSELLADTGEGKTLKQLRGKGLKIKELGGAIGEEFGLEGRRARNIAAQAIKADLPVGKPAISAIKQQAKISPMEWILHLFGAGTEKTATRAAKKQMVKSMYGPGVKGAVKAGLKGPLPGLLATPLGFLLFEALSNMDEINRAFGGDEEYQSRMASYKAPINMDDIYKGLQQEEALKRRERAIEGAVRRTDPRAQQLLYGGAFGQGLTPNEQFIGQG